MLNKKPIFIVAFSRGGSNILLRLLRSHPQVCSPRGETHEVFRGKGDPEPILVRFEKALNYLPIRLLQKEDILSPSLWKERKQVDSRIKRHIDKVLFRDKLKALEPSQNLYKTEGVKYTAVEIRDSRLLCKNLDGLIFLSKMFYEMYPDATFLALVRNGFAVCEGHIRRGVDPATIARRYETACQQIIRDQKHIPNYFILKFEDIVSKPQETLRKIYGYADLDISLVDKIRLATKPIITTDGEHKHVHGTERTEFVWYEIEEFGSHFVPNVNDNQIQRLTVTEKQVILEQARNSLQFFSYI